VRALITPVPIAELERRFGPLELTRAKPFSVQFRDRGSNRLIKIYRGIDPRARQVRELYALLTAPQFGCWVPQVLDHGQHGNITWTAIGVVSGTPLSLDGPDDVAIFLHAADSLLAPLHAAETLEKAGSGWQGLQSPTTSAFLASQISPRMRSLSAWPRLGTQLRDLDTLPIVLLHGDVKPEHVLTGPGHAMLVDWEASSRGPAVLDQSDATFHVLRDLAYANRLSSAATTLLPRTRHHTVALAWRLILWLDRRHSALSPDAIALAERIARVPDAPHPIATAASIMRAAESIGVEY
jgi:hypothetical protein